MNAALARAARAGTSGSSASTATRSDGAVAAPPSGVPATARATTRRTFVSTTGWRCPNANAATARPVYAPIPGNARSASRQSGTSPPYRRVISTAHSCSRSARRGYPSRPHIRIASAGGILMVNGGSPTLPADRPKGSLGSVAVVEVADGVATARTVELWR